MCLISNLKKKKIVNFLRMSFERSNVALKPNDQKALLTNFTSTLHHTYLQGKPWACTDWYAQKFQETKEKKKKKTQNDLNAAAELNRWSL